MAPRLADLVRKARRLASERDRLIDSLAEEWTRALRGQGLSPTDLDELWAGLTEDAVRSAYWRISDFFPVTRRGLVWGGCSRTPAAVLPAALQREAASVHDRRALAAVRIDVFACDATK